MTFALTTAKMRALNSQITELYMQRMSPELSKKEEQAEQKPAATEPHAAHHIQADSCMIGGMSYLIIITKDWRLHI